VATERNELADALGDVAAGRSDPAAIGRLTAVVGRSARAAGVGALASGRWLAETLIDVAPRIPVRDLETLRAHHGGATGDTLADQLIRAATRASMAVGAAAGALAAAEQLAPPAWVALPLELVVETLAVAAIEMKLVAELHEVFGQPITGSAGDRATAVVRSWAERRGVTPATLLRRGGLGRSARNELVRLVRRRLVRRLGRNLATLAPLMIGAVAGAAVNRRATKDLADAIVRDLR
jgi:hypothetical protein